MSRVKVCKAADLSLDCCKRIDSDGRNPIGIYRLEDGFYAIDDICTHGRALLSAGDVQDGAVICAFHGGSFDIRTGAAVERPCLVPVKTYSVVIEDDTVWVELP